MLFKKIVWILLLVPSLVWADCTQMGTCTQRYKVGTVVTLTAKPDPGSVFVQWTGDVCNGSKNKICTFTMPTTPVNVQAEFKKLSPPTGLRISKQEEL